MTDLREHAPVEEVKAQHSPLPWRIDANRRALKTGGGFNYYLRSADDVYVVQKVSLIEDAEFIVRAVNAHQQLIDALKAIVSADDRKSLTDIVAAMPSARAALAAAEGNQ